MIDFSGLEVIWILNSILEVAYGFSPILSSVSLNLTDNFYFEINCVQF
jgi:hypothetical protein